MKINTYTIFAMLVLAVRPAGAITIDATWEWQGGNTYLAEYSVFNDGSLGAGVALQSFSILFDPQLYDTASLLISSTPEISASWDEQILAGGLLTPFAYDAFALSGGLPDGLSLTGFAVQAIWLGSGMPTSQSFEIYDPATFDLLETGQTQLQTAAIPLPGTGTLLLSAFGPMLIGFGSNRRRRADSVKETVS